MNEVGASIVKEIIKLHSEAKASYNSTVSKALRIGELLTNAKAKMEHGNFLKFLEELPFSQRTAYNYMNGYGRRDSLPPAEPCKMLGSGKPKSKELATLEGQNPNESGTNSNQSCKSDSTETPPVSPPNTHGLPPQSPPRPKTTADLPKDEEGHPLNDKLQVLWKRRGEMETVIQAISKIKCEIQRVEKAQDILWAGTDFQNVVAWLDKAQYSIKQYKPYAICPSCQGTADGCRPCCNRGIVGKFKWDSGFAKEMKERLKK
jgi:hypothetical protein